MGGKSIMKKKVIAAVVGFIALALAAVWLIGCGHSHEARDPNKRVHQSFNGGK